MRAFPGESFATFQWGKRPRLWALCVLCAGGVVVLAGCAARREPSPARFRSPDDQAPQVDLTLYKSPEDRPGPQNRSHHLVVAVSGGGHRAGNLAFGVLLALEKLECGADRDGLKEIDYFSTVSGGGFGVGAYLATLSDSMAKADGDADARRAQFQLAMAASEKDEKQVDLMRNLERGYNNRAARAGLSLRAAFTSLDRGDFLEAALDRFLLGSDHRGGRSLTLGDVWVPKGSAAPAVLPSWVANATAFQNGAIVPLSPDTLQAYGVTSYIHARKKVEVGGSDLAAYATVPLAVAMKASASFPGLLPATTLAISGKDPANPYLHLLDGGLSDNLGMLTAVSLMRQLAGQGTSALVLIDAFTGETEPFSKESGSPRFYQSIFRTTGISLDSWHSRFQGMLRAMLGETPTVYLGFSSLDDKVDDGLRTKVEAIRTEINISVEQQKVLLQASDLLVAKNREALCKAIFPGK